jgi:hypothetical protein
MGLHGSPSSVEDSLMLCNGQIELESYSIKVYLKFGQVKTRTVNLSLLTCLVEKLSIKAIPRGRALLLTDLGLRLRCPDVDFLLP